MVSQRYDGGADRGYLCGQPVDVVHEKFPVIKRINVGICFVVNSGDEVGHDLHAIVLFELTGMDYAIDAV